MTRRRPFASRPLPRVLDFDRADDGRGEWTIREHSRFKRQWRALRRAPALIQIIVGLFAFEWFACVFFAAWLAATALLSQ
jgi:hypothetical protein